MRNWEELVQKFRQRGYKMTPQRRAILRAVAGSASHPTAEQIHENVLESMPDTSLATVYNTLRELVAIEEAYELDLGHGVRRYETSKQEHAHLVCLRCGQIEDAPGDIGKLTSLFQHGNGFCPVRLEVTIRGYCSDCAASIG